MTVFRAVRADEAELVEALYRSVVGTPFCTWDESYPTRVNIDEDIEAGTLYGLFEADTLIGAVSVVPENELDHLTEWRHVNGPAREIARVAVHPTARGRGLAVIMVEHIETILRGEGCGAIHLLVARENLPAYRTYMKRGFRVLGNYAGWGHEYYICDKLLEE